MEKIAENERLKRVWDDIRTVGDMLGPFTRPGSTPDYREIEKLADSIDDIAGRLYKSSERIKETR